MQPLASQKTSQPVIQRSQPRIRITLGEHIFVIGRTGTGKTTVIKRLLAELQTQLAPRPQRLPWYRRLLGQVARREGVALYILDNKQDPKDFGAWRGKVQSATAPGAIRSGIQVWQPIDNDPAQFDQWFANILNARRRAIVFVDELSLIGGASGQNYPLHYSRILKTGRGHGISMVTASQAAAYIPRDTFGQATHLFAFMLKTKHDVRVISEEIGDDVSETPDHHGFWYKNLTNLSPAFYYSDYRDLFRS